MAVLLKQQPKISASDVDIGGIDFSDYLDAGELLTGTPTVVEVDTVDLTLSNKTINTTTLTILDNEDVIAGQAVLFKIIGQKAGKSYLLRITVSTTSTPARTKVVDCLVHCVN